MDERLKGMRNGKFRSNVAKVRESRICWLIRGITGQIVGLSVSLARLHGLQQAELLHDGQHAPDTPLFDDLARLEAKQGHAGF